MADEVSMVTCTDERFPAGKDSCAAWVFRPSEVSEQPRPVVVLGHGLGAVREMGLATYGRAFAAAGIVAVAFDYRGFGASDGTPRQVLSVRRQLADWDAALAFARQLDGVDPARLALWGTSFGGGHALAVAARHPEVAAVVSQCPFTDGLASTLALGPASALRMAPRIAADITLALLRSQRTARVNLVGKPGSAALMSAPDALAGYHSLVPPDLEFDATVAGRIGLLIGFYRPGRYAKQLRMPVLVALADRDSVAPVGATLRHLRSAPTVDLQRYPVGHFEIYQDQAALAYQVDFLRRHLQD